MTRRQALSLFALPIAARSQSGMASRDARNQTAAGFAMNDVRATPGTDAPAFALELSAVQKSFGVTPIIRGVSLDIARGERHAMIGPNGAGKSTLFNLISGRFAPSAGAIRLHGENVSGLPPYALVDAPSSALVSPARPVIATDRGEARGPRGLRHHGPNRAARTETRESSIGLRF